MASVNRRSETPSHLATYQNMEWEIVPEAEILDRPVQAEVDRVEALASQA